MYMRRNTQTNNHLDKLTKKDKLMFYLSQLGV